MINASYNIQLYANVHRFLHIMGRYSTTGIPPMLYTWSQHTTGAFTYYIHDPNTSTLAYTHHPYSTHTGPFLHCHKSWQTISPPSKIMTHNFSTSVSQDRLMKFSLCLLSRHYTIWLSSNSFKLCTTTSVRPHVTFLESATPTAM